MTGERMAATLRKSAAVRTLASRRWTRRNSVKWSHVQVTRPAPAGVAAHPRLVHCPAERRYAACDGAGVRSKNSHWGSEVF